MDLKTTALTSELKTDVEMMPDIPGLHFGILSENCMLFDYTAYFEENKELKDPGYKMFMRSNMHYIRTLAGMGGKELSELFYQNTNGHILVANELVYLFLIFSNPDLLIYFNSLLSDVMNEGLAFSNSFVYSLASNRIPSDVLKNLIKERENAAGSE